MVKRNRLQYGGTQFPIYRGLRQQRGHGLGGLFRGLFRTVAPMLKTGLTHIGKRALTAGANALEDISTNNTSVKEAFKKQAKSEIRALNPINMIKNISPVSSKKSRKRATSKRGRATSKRGHPARKFSKITL
jgi:hypothetical protein